MLKFIAKRLGISLAILLLGSLLLFVLVINSGDPLQDLRESNDPNRENRIKQRIENMGLNMPWYGRYFDWLSGASKCLIGQCDLGTAVNGQSVNALVATAAASSLLPSEKVTPGRSLKVYCVASALTVQLSAIHGSISSVTGFW